MGWPEQDESASDHNSSLSVGWQQLVGKHLITEFSSSSATNEAKYAAVQMCLGICRQINLPVILLSPTEHLSFIQAAEHTKESVRVLHYRLAFK